MGTDETLTILSDMCRRYEGWSSKPYLCPAGVWTIGYGSTYGIDGKPVTRDHRPITKDEGDDLLYRDLAKFVSGTLKLCPGLIAYPTRLAAISDFSYNLGLGRLKASTLRKRVNSEDWEGAKSELMKWVRGGGKVLPGLVKRRREEADML